MAGIVSRTFATRFSAATPHSISSHTSCASAARISALSFSGCCPSPVAAQASPSSSQAAWRVDHSRVSAWSLRDQAKIWNSSRATLSVIPVPRGIVGNGMILLDRQRNGDRVILASSSLELSVSAIAQYYGLEHVASRYEGLRTGRRPGV